MRTENHDHAAEYGDVLATPDLLALDSAIPKGGRKPVRERIGGASLGRPLLYALRGGPAGHDAAARESAILVCFPFDLEELPDGRRYEEVTLTVRLDDDLYALNLHPPAGTVTGDGTRIAVFGLGGPRLRWTFRATGRGGALRPDGHWAQAVVRLPATRADVSGRLSLSTTTVQRVLGGTLRRRTAQTSHDTPFRIPAAEIWPTTATLAPHGGLPGAWALPALEYPADGTGHEGGAKGVSEAAGGAPAPGGGQLPSGRRRLCLAVDIEKYSARDNVGMIRLQRVLLRTLRSACERAGVAWGRCGRQAQGDGYLLVLEPEIDETKAVPRLLDGLAEGLAATDSRPEESNPGPGGESPALGPRRVRMRASLHQGIVHEADSGYAGSAVVDLFRVLDSGPVRRALADSPDVCLVAAFSDPLYQDLVGTGYEGLSADGFERAEIEVAVKNFSAVAWIRAVRPPSRTGRR